MTGDAAATALTLARGGQAALELHRQRIDDLNVYPVPDGDTGSNLLDTAIALTNGLAELGDDAGREEIARAATRSALMGARGNSGVILSQIVRGFAESLGAEPAAIDGRAVARAVRAASESAYHAVRQPVEGTMLTAVREMAEAAEAAPDLPLPALLDRMLEAGDRAVEHTPELLAALRDAGVVDAGAAGLVEFARGAAAASRGERITAPASISAARPLGVEALHAEPSRYRYCTTFLVEGDGIDAAGLERGLDPSATRCWWWGSRRRSRCTFIRTIRRPRSPWAWRWASSTGWRSPTCTRKRPSGSGGCGWSPPARRPRSWPSSPVRATNRRTAPPARRGSSPAASR